MVRIILILLLAACNTPCKKYETKYQVGLTGKTIMMRPVSVCVDK